MANITKQASTRFSIVKRSKGQSAVEKASYISRSILVSEYDGQTYRPKYHEDLVHSEISLPQNAPREYADRATLWNAVELSEKGQKSQLARMLKASLPNEWSYELAEEVVRDYVQRNFVDKGMCADWAIHDSENDKGQRNLHIHVLLTMRPLTENGEWGAKTKKVYVLDENGERIPLIDKKTGKQKVDKRNRKQWKCQTVESTDWNSRENAMMWRRDLAETINATNEQLGIAVHWEHRSFKEQGIDKEPTIHIGAVANWALGTLAPVLSEIAPSHALQRANFVRQAPHRRCRSERAGGRQAGLDYPADDESRGRDRSHESGKSDVMGAVNELHPLPGRGNHQDGTNLLLREVKL